MRAAAAATTHNDLARDKARLLEIIREKSLLTTGGPFKLASGGVSDYYLDLKPTSFDGEGAALIATLTLDMLADEPRIDAVGGLELGAVPIVAAVCARAWPERRLEGFVVRKERKDHGTSKKIDGNFRDGAHVVLLEDVITRGGSSLQAVEAVRARGGTVIKVISVVDRLEGAAQNLEAKGIALRSIFTARDLLGK